MIIKDEICYEIGDVEICEEVILEIDSSPGNDNRNSGEMLNICGRRVRGPALDPPEPPEVELTDVYPVRLGVRWSEAHKQAVEQYYDDEKLWELVKDHTEDYRY